MNPATRKAPAKRRTRPAAGVPSVLRDLLAEYPDRITLAQDLKVCEQEGDRITHDIIHRLAGGGRVRAPFDAGDGYALASALEPSRGAKGRQQFIDRLADGLKRRLAEDPAPLRVVAQVLLMSKLDEP